MTTFLNLHISLLILRPTKNGLLKRQNHYYDNLSHFSTKTMHFGASRQVLLTNLI